MDPIQNNGLNTVDLDIKFQAFEHLELECLGVDEIGKYQDEENEKNLEKEQQQKVE